MGIVPCISSVSSRGESSWDQPRGTRRTRRKQLQRHHASDCLAPATFASPRVLRGSNRTAGPSRDQFTTEVTEVTEENKRERPMGIVPSISSVSSVISVVKPLAGRPSHDRVRRWDVPFASLVSFAVQTARQVRPATNSPQRSRRSQRKTEGNDQWESFPPFPLCPL
jgi:hypothetical protein